MVRRGVTLWLDNQLPPALAAISVAQDVVGLRESRGLSQAQLADRLGITQSAIAQLESAQPKNVELRTLVRVATALGAHSTHRDQSVHAIVITRTTAS
jgi:predicted transcriptional regulator